MGFVQIIEFRTSRLAEVQELGNAGRKRPRGSARRAAALCVWTETIRAANC